jgi:hypothetical protein
MMKHKWAKILMLCLASWLPLTVASRGVPEVANEYKIKTALIYNFLKLTEWPEAPAGAEDKVHTLGLLGNDDTYEACMTLKGRTARNKTVQLVRLSPKDLKDKDSKALKDVDILYYTHTLDSKEKLEMKTVLAAVKGKTVLTIGETSGFLEQGGIINFFVADNRIRFEVNLYAAKNTGINIKTSVLKLAERVIKKD